MFRPMDNATMCPLNGAILGRRIPLHVHHSKGLIVQEIKNPRQNVQGHNVQCSWIHRTVTNDLGGYMSCWTLIYTRTGPIVYQNIKGNRKGV